MYWADLHLFQTRFVIGWENNRDSFITMPLSLKTIGSVGYRDQWNKMFGWGRLIDVSLQISKSDVSKSQCVLNRLTTLLAESPDAWADGVGAVRFPEATFLSRGVILSLCSLSFPLNYLVFVVLVWIWASMSLMIPSWFMKIIMWASWQDSWITSFLFSTHPKAMMKKQYSVINILSLQVLFLLPWVKSLQRK